MVTPSHHKKIGNDWKGILDKGMAKLKQGLRWDGW